jgi:hypothetical protein
MNGFVEIFRSSGNVLRFHPLAQRTDLGAERVQAELQRIYANKETVGVACTCRSKSETHLPLIVRRLESGVFTLAREEVSGHLPGCVFERDNDGQPAMLGTDIFFPAVDGTNWSRNTVDTDVDFEGPAGQRHETFSSYSRHVLSDAQMVALAAANRSGTSFRMPNSWETLKAFDRAITERTFDTGRHGFQMANESGGELRIGLAFELPVLSRQAETPLSIWWWHNGKLRPSMAIAAPVAYSNALGTLTRYDRLLGPPYVVIAYEDHAGTLVQIFVHQVYVDGKYLVPTESAYEQAFTGHLLSHGAVFVKPVRRNDWSTTLAAMQLGSVEQLTWNYRPDFIALPGAYSRRLHIRELRGFRLGANPAYDELMARKREYFAELARLHRWVYAERNGWDYGSTGAVLQPTDW